MRESNFIQQNKKKWAKYEALLDRKDKDPDALSDLYIHVTDDLSYARTFYPNRSVRVYLNNLATKIHGNIYKNKKTNRKRFITFWLYELPRIVYESKYSFYLSLFIFVLSVGIGMLSTAYMPEFFDIVISEQYREMTEEFIAEGDPMAVYKQGGETASFLGITQNNIRVAFLAFVSGLMYGVGTVYLMMYNGAMLGSFQYFFIEKGLFMESFLTVWMHGTFEISAIIIAGAAGFELARGIIFPGTYTRLQAVQISGKRAIKIMLGTVPMFLVAGFIEGFITRHTEIPGAVRGLAILFMFLLTIGYWWIYPWYRSRTGWKFEPKPEKGPPGIPGRWYSAGSKTSGEILSDVITLFKDYFKKFQPIIWLGALLVTLTSVFALPGGLASSFDIEMISDFESFGLGNFTQYFDYGLYIWFFPVASLFFGSIATLAALRLRQFAEGEEPRTSKVKAGVFFGQLWKGVLVVVAIHAVFFLDRDFAWFPFVVLLPFASLIIFISIQEKTNPFAAMGRMFKLLTGQWGQLLGLLVTLLGLMVLLILLIGSLFPWFYFEAINMNLPFESSIRMEVYQAFYIFISFGGLGLLVPMFIFAYGIMYFSLREVKEAPHLKEMIEKLGKKSIHYGVEAEND